MGIGALATGREVLDEHGAVLRAVALPQLPAVAVVKGAEEQRPVERNRRLKPDAQRRVWKLFEQHSPRFGSIALPESEPPLVGMRHQKYRSTHIRERQLKRALARD